MTLQIGIPRDLDVKLSPDEVAAKAQMLARLMGEISTVEEDKAKAVRSFSVKLRDMKRRAQELARNVSKEEEMRPVLTSERIDLRRLQVETYRHDTGDVIESRAMTQEELEDARQGDLFHEQRPTRVSTEPKPKLDLESPGAAPAEPSNVVPIRPAETKPDEPTPDTEITDPEGLQNGKVAAKAKKRAEAAERAEGGPKRTKRRGGLNIGSETGPEPKATPSERVGAATIVKEPETTSEPAPEEGSDPPAPAPEPDVDESDTDPVTE